MILQLDQNHRVYGGERAWELQSLRISKGKQEWRPYKWFTSLREALRAAAQAEIRTAPVEGVADAIEAVNLIVDKYSAIIDGAADEIADMVGEVAA